MQDEKVGIEPALLASLDTAHYTNIAWVDTVKKFGTIREGGQVKLQFNFKNTGKNALYVIKVRPSCGCTIAAFSDQPVMPGQMGFISAVVNTKYHPGAMHKTITVKTNTNNKLYQQLAFMGEVVAVSN
jgi:hypothetical protein